MAIRQAWKYICAEDDDAPFAKKLFHRIQAEYTAPGVRSPVTQWIVDDDFPELFLAVTNCGWSRLDLEAWDLGRPGTRRYIWSLEALDPELKEIVFRGRPEAPAPAAR